MKPSAVIREAKCVLFERGHAKHDYQTRDGRVCLVGALHLVEKGHLDATDECTDAERIVADVIRTSPDWSKSWIGGWNDDPARTFDEVIDVLDKAEKIAERQEALDA